MSSTPVERLEMAGRGPAISWGAVFAGLALLTAAQWLLFLFGSALGIGIADATDAEALDRGFGIGVALWILLSNVLAFFFGGWIAGRLAARPERSVGALHGLTVWSAGTILMLLLGALGVGSFLQAGQSLLSGAGRAAGAAVQQTEGGLPAGIEEAFMERAAQALADVEAARGGSVVTEAEARTTLEELDRATIQTVIARLIEGDRRSAIATLSSRTTLSQEEIEGLVAAVSQDVARFAQQLPGQGPERFSSYAQAVLWTLVIAGVVSLITALLGGSLGAGLGTGARISASESRGTRRPAPPH